MWKTIKGYDGYYEVSDKGEVRGLDRYVYNTTGANAGLARLIKGRIMRQAVIENKHRKGDIGYLVVNLRKDGAADVRPVHRLVAEAFIPNPDNHPVINHIDGNKHNNDVSNLEWCSYSRNNSHALENGLRKPRGRKVLQIDIQDGVIACYKSVTEASRQTDIGRCSISNALNGRAELAGGFMWEYLEGATTSREAYTGR